MTHLDGESLVSLFKPYLPRNAEFNEIVRMDAITVVVSWKLGTYPDRPNKRSKQIRLHVSRETIDDYAGGTAEEREAILFRLVSSLRTALRTFSPDHPSPPWEPVPIVDWHL